MQKSSVYGYLSYYEASRCLRRFFILLHIYVHYIHKYLQYSIISEYSEPLREYVLYFAVQFYAHISVCMQQRIRSIYLSRSLYKYISNRIA